MAEDKEVPDGVREIMFDMEKARREFPGCERKPADFVAALAAQNPDLPMPLIFIMAREFLMVHAKPEPGREEGFANALEWLREQAKV